MTKRDNLKKAEGKIIINRLAAVLKEEQVSNKALSESLGYEQATVSKWATNTIQPPLSTFLRIALFLDRDLRDLFVSTSGIEDVERKRLLKDLAVIAQLGKRVGKK
jgi:transcriptional regulator with XRE-family HTH domain